MRYDSNEGRLSFSVPDLEGGSRGTVPAQAFESIPPQTIYPAYSLHEKDDKITLLGCQRVAPGKHAVVPDDGPIADSEPGSPEQLVCLSSREKEVLATLLITHKQALTLT